MHIKKEKGKKSSWNETFKMDHGKYKEDIIQNTYDSTTLLWWVVTPQGTTKCLGGRGSSCGQCIFNHYQK